MQNLHVAIAYEGPAEKEVVSILIKRLFADIPFEIMEVKSPHKGLIGYLPSYIDRFSEINADLFLFFTDEDKDPEREKIIKEICERKGLDHKIVVGLSKPHFEGWLLADQDIVKKVFGLSGSEPLPYNEHSHYPKKQLELLQRNMEEGKQVTLYDARVSLVSEMDFKKVESRCKDFYKFKQEFDKKVSSLIM